MTRYFNRWWWEIWRDCNTIIVKQKSRLRFALTADHSAPVINLASCRIRCAPLPLRLSAANRLEWFRHVQRDDLVCRVAHPGRLEHQNERVPRSLWLLSIRKVSTPSAASTGADDNIVEMPYRFLTNSSMPCGKRGTKERIAPTAGLNSLTSLQRLRMANVPKCRPWSTIPETVHFPPDVRHRGVCMRRAAVGLRTASN